MEELGVASSGDEDDAQYVNIDEDDVGYSINETAALNAIALLADTWDVDSLTDLEVCAQLVQANAHAYFSFSSEEGEGKAKWQNEGQCPVSPSHLSLKNRPRRL